MIKMMPISHQQAYALGRNAYNWAWAVMRNPWEELPPFTLDGITPLSYTVSEWKLRPLTIRGAVKEVGTPESLTDSLLTWERGDNSDTLYYPATKSMSVDSECGLYEYYVKLSDDSEYISELFWFIPPRTATAGDFSNASPNDDWNNDFWK